MARPAGEVDPRHDGTPKLGKVLDFMRLLWAVDHGLQSMSKRMEARIGLTGPQRLVLRLVARFPESAAGRIADLLRIHPSTLTGVLKRLEQRGLLERIEDTNDRRRALLRLTEEGRRMDAHRGPGTVEAAVRRALARFDPEQVKVAEDLLAAIAEELDRE